MTDRDASCGTCGKQVDMTFHGECRSCAIDSNDYDESDTGCANCDGDGHTHPVVAIFDADGDECEPSKAVSAVAGTEGRWFVLDLSEFNAGAFQ